MIKKSIIDKLKDLPIEQVANEVNLNVSHHKCLCPFHDDNRPSLTFNIRKNRYKCYVCDAHGGPIDLTMHQMRLNFRDACMWLGSRFGIYFDDEQNSSRWNNVTPIPIKKATIDNRPSTIDISDFAQLVAQPVLTPEAQRFLFEERKLNKAVINWCGISSTHTHLLIPYFDTDGSLKSIQWRYLGKYANPQLPNEPRFRFPKGSTCSIYNLQILKLLKEHEPLYIAEGCSDCWALLSAGHKAIAIPSATLLKPDDLAKIQSTIDIRHSTLHIFPDDDTPGERLFLQIREISPHVTRHQLPAGCKDYAEYYASTKC